MRAEKLTLPRIATETSNPRPPRFRIAQPQARTFLTHDCRPVTVRGELGSVTLQMTVQGSSGPADLPRRFSKVWVDI